MPFWHACQDGRLTPPDPVQGVDAMTTTPVLQPDASALEGTCGICAALAPAASAQARLPQRGDG